MKKDNRISITTVTHMFTGILCIDIKAKIPTSETEFVIVNIH